MQERRGRRRLGEAKWRELLRQFDAGSDTVDVFCKREGVTRSSFQRWRSRISDSTMPRSASAAGERMPEPSPVGFVELGGLSLPLAASTARLEITLELGSGVTLRLVRG